MTASNTWQIRGDLHVHASHSFCDRHKEGDPVLYGEDCGAQAIVEMRHQLRTKAYDYLAIVNHATDPVRPTKFTPESEEKIREHIAAVQTVSQKSAAGDPKLLTGIEASFLPDGGLDVSNAMMCAVDVVIASRHGNTTDWTLGETIHRLDRVFAQSPIHILGHPTRYVPMESVASYRTLLELCRDAGVAFELNLRYPFGAELIAAIVASGVIVSLGSDIHGELLTTDNSNISAIANSPTFKEMITGGLMPERVLNTYQLSALQSFLAKRKSVCHTLET